MNDDITRDILRRLQNLERDSVRMRRGEVTGTGPLDVALGGASTSYEDVQAVDGGMSLDAADQIAALIWGNDLLVLGRLGAGGIRFGSSTVTYPGASQGSNATTITHGLGVTPTSIQITGGVGAFDHLFSVFAVTGSTSFDVAAVTRDESSPAGGTVRAFYWVAFV